jgi:hypothetical protein
MKLTKEKAQMKNQKAKVETRLERQEKSQSKGHAYWVTISPMKYFLVKVKMGHVGRNKYLLMDLPIRARDMKQAVQNARQHGGVKRDHKDWCLEKPREISYEEYCQKKSITYSDEYWQNKTRSRLGLYEDRIVEEANYRHWKDMKTNTQIFIKTRDENSIKYKVRKEKLKMRISKNLDYEFGAA